MVLTISFLRGTVNRVCYLKYSFAFNGISYAADFRSATFAVGHCLMRLSVAYVAGVETTSFPGFSPTRPFGVRDVYEREPRNEAGVERDSGRGEKGNRIL